MTDINTWFLSLPPVTRYYFAATTAITIITSLQVVNPYYVVFIPDAIVKNFEIWRLITSFCYFGRFGFPWMFEMAFLQGLFRVISTRSLEQLPMFLNNPKSLYWLVACEVVSIIALGWFAGIALLGNSLVFSFLYIGCRYEPDKIFRLLWGFDIKGLHLPFFIMGFRLLEGQSIIGELIGLAIGEVVYYVKESVPEKYGYDLLASPNWFNSLVNWVMRQFGAEPRNNPAPGRQYAGFPGRGHRLG